MSMEQTNPAMDSMRTELTKSYIAGCLDTSGTLGGKVQKASDYKLGYTVEPEVAFSRKSPLAIQRVDDFCTKNGVYCSVRVSEGRYTLTIQKPRDVHRFLELLSPYLLDRIEEAEVVMQELVPALQSGRHTESKEGFLEVVGILEELRELNPRGTRSKYDREHFREKWNL